jgi:hypothetical protein
MNINKIPLFVIMVSFLLFSSCMHARTTVQSFTINSRVKIVSGRAMLKIYGQVTENLYQSLYDGSKKDSNSYNDPIVRDGSVMKNETKYLSAGDEYKFSVLPIEVVTINVISLNDEDVQILVYDHRKVKNYILDRANKLGLVISFQNR